jgi:hypothetical protein
MSDKVINWVQRDERIFIVILRLALVPAETRAVALRDSHSQWQQEI